MRDGSLPARPGLHEFRVPAGRFELHVREAGSGSPIVVLHGGPDPSHDYLLPEPAEVRALLMEFLAAV